MQAGQQLVNIKQTEPKPSIPVNTYTSFSLSYIGDAFYGMWCRQNILLRFQNRKRVHLHVVKWVRCQTQAHLAQLIQPFLTLEERNIFRQGRNKKVFSSPKHASIGEYRAATGFECLVGYWYLCKQVNRFEELMLKSEVVAYLETALSANNKTNVGAS